LECLCGHPSILCPFRGCHKNLGLKLRVLAVLRG
jgi:hypothetical protein